MIDEETKKCLERIKKEAVDVPKTERQTTQLQIPIELAKEFLKQVNMRKKKEFAVPIDSVNKAIGFKSVKNRTSSLRIKLNEQHSNLLDEGDVWKVGTAGKGTLYKIAVIPEPEEKEDDSNDNDNKEDEA